MCNFDTPVDPAIQQSDIAHNAHLYLKRQQNSVVVYIGIILSYGNAPLRGLKFFQASAHHNIVSENIIHICHPALTLNRRTLVYPYGTVEYPRIYPHLDFRPWTEFPSECKESCISKLAQRSFNDSVALHVPIGKADRLPNFNAELPYYEPFWCSSPDCIMRLAG